jgi:hypothetical protein
LHRIDDKVPRDEQFAAVRSLRPESDWEPQNS